MRSLLLLPLVFAVIFSQMSSVRVWGLNYTKYRHVSSLRLARIQKHLANINKPPVFTIQVRTLITYALIKILKHVY